MRELDYYNLCLHLFCRYQKNLSYLEDLQNRNDDFALNNRLPYLRDVAQMAVGIVARCHFGSKGKMLDYYLDPSNYDSQYASLILQVIG